MYSTYDLYQKNGGTLDQSSYLILAKKAAYILDHETMGRARDAPASMAEALADCECAIIDALADGHFAADGVQSFNNDGYSETRTAAKESRAALRSLLARYLTVPVNLLGFGGHAFV
ncbi:MAG TPA: hypothetical protein H9810_02755 [Candidatus Gemmiger excrementavium]|uniref:Uncharacterized protein n=1 Tax=Candidatus Gemmiger excrementavium TaxID=2838608 RepID=A0A9D2F1Z6_9FIRM|nr:hypothetical protein [Candidatus Gemmiger excrementavium]